MSYTGVQFSSDGVYVGPDVAKVVLKIFHQRQLFRGDSRGDLALADKLADECGAGHPALLYGLPQGGHFLHRELDRNRIRPAFIRRLDGAAELGCDLTFALEREEASTSPLVLDIESLVGQNGLTRLAFLRVAFSMYGISRKDVAEKLGLNYTGVNRWFRVDDIAINYIFKIADCYGLKVRPIIKTKQTEAI